MREVNIVLHNALNALTQAERNELKKLALSEDIAASEEIAPWAKKLLAGLAAQVIMDEIEEDAVIRQLEGGES